MKIRFRPKLVTFSLSVCAYCCFLIFPACNKDARTKGNIPNNSNTLTPFSVTVLERTSISAVIQWDTSFNYANNEQVKYKVVLEGVVLDTGLTRTSDTLLNLQKK